LGSFDHCFCDGEDEEDTSFVVAAAALVAGDGSIAVGKEDIGSGSISHAASVRPRSLPPRTSSAGNGNDGGDDDDDDREEASLSFPSAKIDAVDIDVAESTKTG
jgi:hypothetical protein